MKTINIGIIGAGNVGLGVANILHQRPGLIAKIAGASIKVKYICDIDKSKRRLLGSKKYIFTSQARRVINDPEVDIIVELIGGIHPAKEFIIEAMRNGKHIVTANKALLAECGLEIFETAQDCGVDIYFEASVLAGVPIIKVLREAYSGDKINAVLGIVNGTCNFILTKMSEEGVDFGQALKEAQLKGYAEAKPQLDINGWDSAHKLALLALLCFGKFVELKHIYVEGISSISANDIAYARDFGYVIKLLAIAKLLEAALEVRVAPTLLPNEHLLAGVRGVYNAALVVSDLAGGILFNGKGAGSLPAASAAISDIVDLARNIKAGAVRRVPEYCRSGSSIKLRRISEIASRYYIRFSVIDRPGVLAKISGILGRHNISIASVAQKERKERHIVPVVIMTHEAKESSLRLALSKIDKLSVVKAKSVAIRVER
jgi:homoserine dehydrogenase